MSDLSRVQEVSERFFYLSGSFVVLIPFDGYAVILCIFIFPVFNVISSDSPGQPEVNGLVGLDNYAVFGAVCAIFSVSRGLDRIY